MSIVLLAAAAVTVLWPRGRADVRVAAMVPTDGADRTRVSVAAVFVVVAMGLAFVLVGPTAAVAVGIAGASIGHRTATRRREQVDAAGLDQLLDAVAVMIAELSVGAHPARACRQAADDLCAAADGRVGLAADPAPAQSVAAVVSRMAGRAELGGDVAAGIENSGALHQSSWDRVAVAWRTAEQQGLPMADLLAAVRDDLVARRRFSERTRAALAGARATATVLACLPLLGIGLGQAMGADPIAVLLGDGLGGIVLVIGTALVAAGLWWTERITAKVMTP